MSLKGKTLFITGASRGIGLAIALKAARDGANIAIAAKTETPHPKLEGTIHTAPPRSRRPAAARCRSPSTCATRTAVKSAIDKTAAQFGGIDIVVNNASAVSRTPVADTDMKRYDLMQAINTRGTFMVSKYAIPYLEKAANPHILMNSPPLDMQEKWFAGSTGYSIAKFGMSLVALGLAGELRGRIAVNALWPRSTIATAAIKNLLGGERVMRMSRTPGDHGGRRLRDLPQARQELHRPFPDRRHVSRPAKASPTSRSTARRRASRWPEPFSCRTIRRRRPASRSAGKGGSERFRRSGRRVKCER